ncbi:MAG: hypothetical protein GY768_10665 [Planctomycetaceae bacterium]|nr:hypothetical protein [Planctomycetaceae bacterium]
MSNWESGLCVVLEERQDVHQEPAPVPGGPVLVSTLPFGGWPRDTRIQGGHAGLEPVDHVVKDRTLYMHADHTSKTQCVHNIV